MTGELSSEATPLTEQALRLLVDELERSVRELWAVYCEYDENMQYKIVKIVPWAERDYDSKPMKLEGAVDELGAYKKATERLKCS
jgi:hypothetical protein